MDIVDILLAARRDPGTRPAQLPQPPVDAAAAYAAQQGTQAQLGEVGAWKVGASKTGFTCAPIPASAVWASPAAVAQAACPDRGVEAEIALKLGRDLPPRGAPYTAAEVMNAVASAHPAIELLQSRYQDVDAVDPLSALADSLSNHGLVYGASIPNWESIELPQEAVRVLADGVEVKAGRGNPAGDMTRLLVWLANEGSHWAGGLRAGQFVTTGSWTGKDFVAEDTVVRVVFDQCGSVEARYGA